MKIEELILEAENLIKEGLALFSKETKRTLYYNNSEFHIVYSKAVDILLNEYNPKNELEINLFFNENIPKYSNYGNIKEFSETSEQFENLKSLDVNLRIKASKYFRGKALQETSGFRALLFKRPDTFEKLFSALEDNEPKVLRNIIIALGGAHNRYFKHYKVQEKLSPFYYSKISDIRYYTIIWTPSTNKQQELSILKELLNQKQPKKIKELLIERIEDIETE